MEGVLSTRNRPIATQSSSSLELAVLSIPLREPGLRLNRGCVNLMGVRNRSKDNVLSLQSTGTGAWMIMHAWPYALLGFSQLDKDYFCLHVLIIADKRTIVAQLQPL